MNLPHVVLDFMPVGHVGNQPCKKNCARILQMAELRSKRLLSSSVWNCFLSSTSFKGCFHNKKEERSFFLAFSTAWLCVFLFSNGKMCLRLLPVHFFSNIQNKKETLLFPSFKRKQNQNRPIKYNKIKIRHYKRQHDVQQQYQRNKNNN